MKFLATILFAGSLLFSSCDKKEPIIENVAGVMKISETGTCKVLIELNTSTTLFPTNLHMVESFLTDGRRVTVSYRLDSEFVSPCSGSEPALIESIR